MDWLTNYSALFSDSKSLFHMYVRKSIDKFIFIALLFQEAISYGASGLNPAYYVLGMI